jgi:transposase InsO family protein
MPWKETCVMDERTKFIAEWLVGEASMVELCAWHAISRKTGYKWVERHRMGAGLENRSRAPHRPANGLADEIARSIVDLRLRWPSWGPRKLKARLERDRPELVWPAASTIGDLLRREGLIMERRRRRTAMVLERPFSDVAAPNDVWCADFKGWFRTGDGRRCDPLTVSDAYSRFLLECRIVPPRGPAVRACFERLFCRYGLPRAIRTDNGPPFASTGAGGLTRLSVEWLKLGIKLERIAPGEPQQNGRHERIHRTLKAETIRPAAATPREQQLRFERFRQAYNHDRPHEALGQTTPAEHYQASPVRARRPGKPRYDAEYDQRRVRSNGEIKWGGELIFVSEALVGETVGVTETQAGHWLVRFAEVELGLIDRRTNKLRRFTAPRPGRREAQEQTEETVTHVPGPNCHL